MMDGQTNIKLGDILEEKAEETLAASKIKKLTESCRKLHIEQFQDRYCSQYIFRLIISEAIKWAGHVACMEQLAGLW